MDSRQERDLIRLRDALATDPVIRKHWDFSQVANENFWRKGPDRCGSAGCAMGWMPTLFRELKLDRDYLCYRDGGMAGQGANDQDLCAQFFGIREEEARTLFVEGSTNTLEVPVSPLDIAARIDKLLSEYRNAREQEAAEGMSDDELGVE